MTSENCHDSQSVLCQLWNWLTPQPALITHVLINLIIKGSDFCPTLHNQILKDSQAEYG